MIGWVVFFIACAAVAVALFYSLTTPRPAADPACCPSGYKLAEDLSCVPAAFYATAAIRC